MIDVDSFYYSYLTTMYFIQDTCDTSFDIIYLFI